MKDFSFFSRAEALQRIETEVFDVAIIGGGITGAAVARDAALRGLKVILLEADDFASGTSSGSSKLIHGGIRYLEQYEFSLVHHAIQERERLKKLYAPLVQDIPFVFPTFKKSFPPRWKLSLGLHLYDAFSGFRVHHQNLSTAETLNNFPQLRSEHEKAGFTNQLTGACVYIDSFAEDFRLVIELLKSAHKASAKCFSRMKVHAIQKGQDLAVCEAVDLLDKKTYKVKSRFVFNCSGPFSDQVRKLLNLDSTLKLTQGVHFVISKKKLPIESAFVLPDPQLHRILFAIPWKSVTYFGTTDTSIERPQDARATSADLDYVLSIVNKFFSAKIERADVIQSWAAVRPLLKPLHNESNSAISREHRIDENPKNIFHILGGKITSHRLMAEEALDLLVDRISLKKCQTAILPLDVATELEKFNLEKKIEYCIQNEMTLTPLDFIRRRTSLYYENPTEEVARSVTEEFAKQMSFTSDQKAEALNEVLRAYEWDKVVARHF